MKRAIAENLITEDLVKRIFEKNSNETILQSLTDQTIMKMYKLFNIAEAPGAVDCVAFLRTKFSLVDQLECVNTLSIIDDITANTVVVDGRVIMIVKDGAKVIWRRVIGSGDPKDYFFDNLGSGKADTGTYFLSLAVLNEEEWHFEVALTYMPGKEAEVFDENEWTPTEYSNYFIFDKKTQGFTSYRNVDTEEN